MSEAEPTQKHPTEASRSAKPAGVYPAANEIFDLTIDGDTIENQPLEMVEFAGFNPSGWRFGGDEVAGKQSRRFKLVQVGYCSTIEKVKEKIGGVGVIPNGQWINAFKAAFPEADQKGPGGVT